MARLLSSALPIATIFVRIFLVLNIALGVALIALLFVMPNREWIIEALKLQSAPNAERLIWGLRSVAALGVVAIVLTHFMLTRLLAMLRTVSQGDPFVAANAYRLQAIAWILLGLQLLSILIGAIGKSLSTPETPIHLDAGFSPPAWLAVLLTFVLARVFAEGTLMRRDLQGTI